MHHSLQNERRISHLDNNEIYAEEADIDIQSMEIVRSEMNAGDPKSVFLLQNLRYTSKIDFVNCDDNHENCVRLRLLYNYSHGLSITVGTV